MSITNLLRKIKIGPRMFLGFTVMVWLMMLIGAVGYINVGRVGKVTLSVYQDEAGPLIRLYSVLHFAETFRMRILSFLNEIDDQKTARLETDIRAVNGKINTEIAAYLRDIGPGDGDKQHKIKAFQDDWAAFSKSGLALIQAGVMGLREKSLYTALGEQNQVFNKAVKHVNDLIAGHRTSMEQSVTGAQNTTRDTQVQIILFCVLGIFLATIFGHFISWSIYKPLNVLVEVIKVLAKGDLSTRVKVEAMDEVGQVADNINRMADAIANEMAKSTSILTNFPDPLIMIGRKMKVTFMNKAAEELIGIKAWEVVDEKTCDQVFRTDLCNTMHCPKNLDEESDIAGAGITTNLIDAKGRVIPILLGGGDIKDAKGKSVGGFHTIRDISQIVEANRKEHEMRAHLESKVSEYLAFMNKVAAGDLEQKLIMAEDDGEVELSRLGHVLNDTVAVLQKMMSKEKEARDRLETTIWYYSEYVERVAGADLRKSLVIEDADLLGTFGTKINEMRDNIYHMVERIQEAAEHLNASTNEILASSRQQAGGAEKQVSSVNLVAATINEIAAMSTELSRTARSVADFAKDSADRSKVGFDAVSEAMRGISHIQESNQSTSEKLAILNEKAEKISKVVTTIINVADKTNLLSLNAAIEAAKAGEQGRGFAVVAQEIRRLADQTQEASQEIGDMIAAMQGAVAAAVMSMDKASEDVRVGTESAKVAAETLHNIIDNIIEIKPRVDEIAEGVMQQSDATKDVASSIKEIEETVQMTLHSAQQVTQSADDLNLLSTRLREAVIQFKLK
ncbi:MAG: HAMP domain-containing protein [Deltaproteobacteria bacterium]|nr:HAMP domain-containing protein [Deltaproteobacteria bacterium]